MSDKLDQFSQAYLLSRFSYDPLTGTLEWRSILDPVWRDKIWNANFAGKPAGTSDKDGYVVVILDGVALKAHRLIWRMMFGAVPPDEIDHIDLSPSNNRLGNLRLASKNQNMMNQPIYRNNTSGHRGVYWNRKNNNWRAYIKCNGKHYCLGSHAKKESAIAARIQAERKFFGSFAPR